jgi:hypothetical protein
MNMLTGSTEETAHTSDNASPAYLDDVVSSFKRININHYLIKASAAPYFYFHRDAFSLDTHMQGIQRIPSTNFFVISASRWWWNQGILGFIKIDSKKEIRTPIYSASSEGDFSLDKVFHKIVIDKGYFHAGGISLFGDILAVAITNNTINADQKSMIAFYKIPRDENAQINENTIRQTHELRSARIIRPAMKGSNSGAVAITRLPDGKFKNRYLVVNSAYGKTGPIDFYMSKTKDISAGFESYFRRFDFKKISKPHPVAEGLELLIEKDGGVYLASLTAGAYRLFKVMVTGEINKPTACIAFETERSDLVEIPQDTAADKLGGFSLYIDPASGILALYSVASWTGCGPPGSKQAPDQIIKISEHPEVKISGQAPSAPPNLQIK